MLGDYLKNICRVLGIGAGFASLPLLLALASLQPPWPPAIGYVSAVLVLLSALLAWEWTRAAFTTVRRRWIVSGFLLAIIGLIAYLLLYSLFVEAVPGGDLRVVRGYNCTSEAMIVYRDRCPDLPRDALRDAEWEPTVLWTRSSVTVIRLLLTVTWLTFIAGLITTVGGVVAGRKLAGSQFGSRYP